MSIDTLQIGYADRFKWQNAMRAQPRSVLTGDTKNVLAAILECMDRKTQIATRTHRHLARMTGLTQSGVRSCCDKAEAAGWIKIEGRGGIIIDETGKANGLANRYSLAVPATAIARYEGDTCYVDGTYLLWNPDLPAMKLADTCYSHSDNTPLSSPSVSPMSSPVSAGAIETDIEGKKAREIISSIATSDAMSQDRAYPYPDSESTSPIDTAGAGVPVAAVSSIELPVATVAQRGAWGDAWPGEHAMIDPISPLAPESTVERRVVMDALAVAGYDVESSADMMLPDGTSRDRELRSILPAELISILARRHKNGTLREVDLANVLASLDLTPMAENRLGAIREA